MLACLCLNVGSCFGSVKGESLRRSFQAGGGRGMFDGLQK